MSSMNHHLPICLNMYAGGTWRVGICDPGSAGTGLNTSAHLALPQILCPTWPHNVYRMTLFIGSTFMTF